MGAECVTLGSNPPAKLAANRKSAGGNSKHEGANSKSAGENSKSNPGWALRRITGVRTKRVGVIGSGVAGLTAAYLLQRRYEVVLFEADSRLGGHAHTQDVPSAHGGTIGVDSGFIVHNERTYPYLIKLFRELGVRTQETEMSMSISCRQCGLEYAGAKGLKGLFAQPRNLVNPRYLQMLAEVTRFHRHARQILNSGVRDSSTLSLGEFAISAGYSQYFINHFLLPLISTVWSADRKNTLRYPVRYLLEFLHNHGMLAVKGSPTWRTVVGGSREYVQLAVKPLTAVLSSTPVRSLSRTGGGVSIRDDADTVYQVDKVVVATHPDQALRFISDPTPTELELLGAFSYSSNKALLHKDSSFLPHVPAARASWNYTSYSCAGNTGSTQISYDMNRLMRLAEPENHVVTLNPIREPRADSIVSTMDYEHPIFTPESVAAAGRLPELNNGMIAFAGAYHGWGFHEDGCASGARAAESLGVNW